MLEPDRLKNIVLRIKPSISYQDYINAVILTLSSIALFYVLFGLGFSYFSFRDFIPRSMQYAIEFNPESVPTTPTGQGTHIFDLCATRLIFNFQLTTTCLLTKPNMTTYPKNLWTNRTGCTSPNCSLAIWRPRTREF